MLNSPLWLDVDDCADVVLCCEHELGVEEPLGLVVEAGGRVDLHDLVVLDRQVVTRPLQVSNLGRKAAFREINKKSKEG